MSKFEIMRTMEKESIEDKILKNLSSRAQEILDGSKTAIEALSKMEEWDKTTFNHLVSMINFSARLADEMEMSEDDSVLLLEACAVHDRGKEFVSPEILNKKGPLSEEEQAEMRKHPAVGALLLKSEGRTDLADISILHHAMGRKNPYPSKEEIEKVLPGHSERMEKNLKIKKMGELLAIIDMNDALLAQDRPYKGSLTKAQSAEIIEEEFPGKKDLINLVEAHAREWRTRVNL